jgi:putative membrane protein
MTALVRVAVTAVALVAAGLLVPGLRIRWGDEPEVAVLTVVVLAVVLGLINSFVRPVIKLLSLPLNLLTFGTFSFVLNAALLLLLAGVVDAVWEPVLVLGDFPPTLSVEAFVAAVAGSLVISLVSTALSALIPRV